MKPRWLLPVLALFVFSCGKDDDPGTKSSVSGKYIGPVISKTYVTYTGQTSVDTIDAHLEISCSETGTKGLRLSSNNPTFNNVILQEKTITDTSNSHYNSEKYYEKDYDEENHRIYYLDYVKTAAGHDSIYIHSFTPPMGGWNSSLSFSGKKF